MTHAICANRGRFGPPSRSATEFAAAARAFAKPVTLAWLVVFAPVCLCQAGELTVTVLDLLGKPVAEVVTVV
jgi:hypothetical protein